MKWNWGRDSNSLVVSCAQGQGDSSQGEACFTLVDSLRPGLSGWIGEIKAREEYGQGYSPRGLSLAWQVEMRAAPDPHLPDPALSSLIKITFSSGSRKRTYRPTRGRGGTSLCLESGCPPPMEIRSPLESRDMGEGDEGGGADPAFPCLRAKGKAILLSPAPGWVAGLDSVSSGLRLTVDHPRFRRTVFAGPFRLAPGIEVGRQVRAGETLGQGGSTAPKPVGTDVPSGPSAPILITWLENGSPILPISWQ